MSSSSATVGVEKATSDLLIGPDWTMNIDICDSINSLRWQAKDVIKVLKKRLQHKNPKVQLLALTLLETMIKNCGDNVHFQIAEKNILQEMVKVVRKNGDMHVRDKILVLIDSWQEAFGGARGKYPQYYWAYEELRRSGVGFPQRSQDAVPILMPPVAHPTPRNSMAGYGMPSDASRRLDEALTSEMENLSFSKLESMRSVLDLLTDMLQAVNPNDSKAVKDEVIVDLVSQCRSNQRKLVQMLGTTGDEELLGQGLALNDSLQSLLAKHDAIESGSPLPTEAMGNSSPVPTEVREGSPKSDATPVASASFTSSLLEEEEEEDDDFAQLARRRTKISTVQSESAATGHDGQGAASHSTSDSNALVLTAQSTSESAATISKTQDMIELLSITLSTTSSTSPPTPPSTSSQNMHQVPVSPSAYHPQLYSEHQQVSYSSYTAPWAQERAQLQPVPQSWAQQPLHSQQWSHQQTQQQITQSHAWAQTRQAQPQPWSESQTQPWNQPQQAQSQPWEQPQSQPWAQSDQPQSQLWAQQLPPQQAAWTQSQPPVQASPQSQPPVQASPQSQPPQLPPQSQPPQPPQSPRQQPPPQSPQPQQHPPQSPQPQQPLPPQSWPHSQHEAPQQSSKYPLPPWATAPASSNQGPLSATETPYDVWTSRANSSSSGPLQTHNSFPTRRNIGQATGYGEAQVSSPRQQTSLLTGQKPFVPSYRLFEDLNVLGNADAGSNNSPKMSGQSM